MMRNMFKKQTCCKNIPQPAADQTGADKNRLSECGSLLIDLLWIRWGEPNPLSGEVAPHLFKSMLYYS